MSATSRPKRYRRSPFLVLQWEGGELVALNADTLQQIRIPTTLIDLLSHLGNWICAGDLVSMNLSIEDEDLLALTRIGLLQCSDDAGTSGSEYFVWDPLELAIQRRTSNGGYRPENLQASPPPNLRNKVKPHEIIPLPEPAFVLTANLSDVLNRRRTVREYADRSLQLQELSTLLYHSARIVRIMPHPTLGDRALRTYPTAGARSELEVYIVSCNVSGLLPGAYYYDPSEHHLAKIRDQDSHQAGIIRSAHAATGDTLSRDPSAILLITAVFERVMWKYRDLGLSLIYKDVGTLFQTLYLVATALGLAPCAIGRADEAANSRWLGLDPLCESQVGCFLVAPARSPGSDTSKRPNVYEPAESGGLP